MTKATMCLDYFIEWWGEQNEAISTKEVFWKVKIVTLLRVILQLSLFRFHLVAFASPFPMSYDGHLLGVLPCNRWQS